jgi:tetratricopeptide (TPR) repeat protein
VEQDGAYHPVGDIDSLDVPETLIALIAARLDGLPAADRALLQDAAVLGQSFTVAGLEAVSGMPRDEIDARLASLVRREVLERQADPRSPERGQYAFVQALIREVAYNTLARADRRTRHLAAARYFESVGGEELAGALAAQYLAAYRSSPQGPEADSLAAQARVSLRAAAERASSLGSPRQAVAFLREALEVTHDASEEADILERAGAEAGAAGQGDVAQDLLERAITIRRAAGDRRAVARASYLLGRALLDSGDKEPAASLLAAAAEEFRDLEDDPSVIALGGQLARSYMQVNADEAALEVCERVLLAAERADLVPIIADTLITRGTCLCNLRRYREGQGVLRVGIAVAEDAGLGKVALRGLNNLVSIASDLDPRAALEACRSALVTARRLGLPTLETSLIAGHLGAAYHTGDWPESLRLAMAGLQDEQPSAVRALLLQSSMWIRLALGVDLTDDLGQVRAYLGRMSDPVSQSGILDMAALEAWCGGRLDEARRSALASNALAAYPAMIVVAIRCALWARDLDGARTDMAQFDAVGAHGPAFGAYRQVLAAGVAALAGDVAEALRGYRDGRAALHILGLRWDEALAGLDMITLLPGEPESRVAADEVRSLMVDLGATPFLTRLDAALAVVTSGSAATA